MSKANQFAKNEEGVSAVIGVILMVAITVILAAVIAAFVIGMGQGVKKTYTVAVTASRSDSQHISITNMGGNDVDKLTAIVDGAPFKVFLNGNENLTVVSDIALNDDVGSGVTMIAGARSHLIVVGVFADGTEQVLLETDV